MRRVFLSSLLSLVLAACVTTPDPQRYSGDFQWGFETSSFVPDGGQSRYWLSAEEDVWTQITGPIQQTGRGPWGRLHLVVEGELSAPGHYGQLGAYSRELRVTRVIESRPIVAEPQGS